MTIRIPISKCIRHGAAVGIVVAWLVVGSRVIVIGLVGVKVRKRRYSIWVLCGAIGFWNRSGAYRMGVTTGTRSACEIQLGVVFRTEACPSCGVSWHRVDITTTTVRVIQLWPFDCFIYIVLLPNEIMIRYKEENARSSKSEKRFLVNFQTKNETIAMTAIPPATERPIIEPVPRLLESLEVDDVCEADAVELEEVCVTTMMLVIVSPAEFVVICSEVLSVG